MYEVCFDLCSRLVLDHDEAMFLSIGPHQDTEPRLLCEPDEHNNRWNATKKSWKMLISRFKWSHHQQESRASLQGHAA